MGILEPLSRRSMPTGRVVGVEPRPALLLAAREFVARAKLENVRLLDTSPERTTLPDESFHFVHERFLLSAGGNEEALLEEMVRMTRPGGFVALQEPDSAAWRCYPDHDAWTRLRDATRAAYDAAGGDLDAGGATFTLLREIGLEDVRIRAATIALQGAHPAKRALVELAETHRERILETGSMEEREFDQTLAECDRIARDPATIVVSFLITQVWGRKKGRFRR
jgi:SAM-dependent methyltransferase